MAPVGKIYLPFLDPNRLILPNHRLIGFVFIGVACFGVGLSQLVCGLDVILQPLGQGLNGLGMKGVLTFGEFFQIAGM